MLFTREQREEFKSMIREVFTEIFNDDEYISMLVESVNERSEWQKKVQLLEEKVTAVEKQNIEFKSKIDVHEQYLRKNT